jgi:hypothetical protein
MTTASLIYTTPVSDVIHALRLQAVLNQVLTSRPTIQLGYDAPRGVYTLHKYNDVGELVSHLWFVVLANVTWARRNEGVDDDDFSFSIRDNYTEIVDQMITRLDW